MTAAAERARRHIHPLGSVDAMEAQIARWMSQLLGDPQTPELDPLALYRKARRTDSRMSGYYNHNVRIASPVGPVLVRIPVRNADQMDLRIWPEADVLRCLALRVDRISRLLHVSRDPPFQIHDFVSGWQLNDLAPRGTPVPPTVVPDVLRLFRQLGDVQRDELPPTPAGWPADGDCVDFATRLSGITQRVFDEYSEQFGSLFHGFGIPVDPLATTQASWVSLASRPFRIVHADVHRKNMVVIGDGVVFLDWELALWGDPVYELAVHVHKMTYLDDELATLLRGWEGMTDPASSRSWQHDLAIYQKHERIKSAIVDSVRYAKEIIAPTTSDKRRKSLVDKLTGKLNAAGDVWGWRKFITADDVKTVIERWHRTTTGR
ncbi:MAG: phosphotransferase family protein [Sciscionella sp.]